MSSGSDTSGQSKPDTLPYAVPSKDVDRLYFYWRVRILAVTMVGYALYYFVRTNISVPLKAMQVDLGYTKDQLGLITTVGGVTYGIAKFINGFIGDHANPRYFMAIGLLGAAAMNIFFGMSSALLFFLGFWMVNNFFQGMGFPPCAKSMAYWFSPKERASVFGIWHSSHMVGAALIGVLTGYIVNSSLGWRGCFYIPAGLAILGSLIVVIFLRDTPESLGLPPIEVYRGEESPEELAEELAEPVKAPVDDDAVVQAMPDETMTYWQVVMKYILLNPYMWLISFANLSVYVLRYAQLTWGPTFLQEYKHMTVVASGWLFFGAEMAGLVARSSLDLWPTAYSAGVPDASASLRWS